MVIQLFIQKSLLLPPKNQHVLNLMTEELKFMASVTLLVKYVKQIDYLQFITHTANPSRIHPE